MKHVQTIATLTAMAAVMVFNGCVEELAGTNEEKKAETPVKIAFTPNTPISEIAYRGELFCTGSDFDTIWGDAYVDSTGFSGVLKDIPVGNSRLVGVTIFDSLNTMRYSGSKTTAITMGDNTPLHIVLNPVTQTGSLIVTGEVNEGTGSLCDSIQAQDSIIYWQGELDHAPYNPETHWGYYNSSDEVSYLFNGSEWDTLCVEEVDPEYTSITYLGYHNSTPYNPQFGAVYNNRLDNYVYLFDGMNWEIAAMPTHVDTIWVTDTLYTDTNFVDYTEYFIDDSSRVIINEVPLALWYGTFEQSPNSPELYGAYYNRRENRTFWFNGVNWESIIEMPSDTLVIQELVFVDMGGMMDSIPVDSFIDYDTLIYYDTLYDTTVQETILIDDTSTFSTDFKVVENTEFGTIYIDTVTGDTLYVNR